MSTGRDNQTTDREELILALVEGELDAASEAAVLAALEPAAVAKVRAMRRHRSALRSVADVAPPAGLLDRVGAVLEREAVTGPSRDAATFPIGNYRAETPWARRLAVAAGLMLMAGGVGYWSLWLSSTPGPAGPAIALHQPGRDQAGREQATSKTELAAAQATGLAEASRQADHGADHDAEADEPRAAIAMAQPRHAESPSSPIDFDEPDLLPMDSAAGLAPGYPVTTISHGDSLLYSPTLLGVFSEMPTSLDLEDAARLAEEGRLVIRVRADRPALAAARLLAQADSRADKGRLWRLMPCPPSDFSTAVESAMPPDLIDDDRSGVTVPFRVPMRPTVETTLSVELDPSVALLAIVQAELESISEGAVILDVLEHPVTMAPPCSEDGGLRRWTSVPSSAVHSVVVPLVVESGE